MPRPRAFYGWWVTLALAVMVFVSTGIRFTVGPFLKPITADLDLDRASFSLVISAGLFIYGALMPVVGWIADRVGTRAVTIAGTLLFAAAAAATGLVGSFWQFFLVYAVCLALGLAATGPVVATTVVSRWFVRRRATALSLLGAASMSGMSLLVPVVMWLILAVGWRAAYGVIGAAILVLMLPLAIWVVRDSPEAVGLAPDGGAGTAQVNPAAERTEVSRAVQSVPFWQLGGALATCGFSMSLLSTHGVPMLTDHGYSAMLASWALGVLGASSVGFSVLLGATADRFGCRPVLAWIYGGRALAFAGLYLVRDHPAALLLVAALSGATMGGTFAMTSTLTATIFGRYSVGTVFGTMFLIHQTGSAMGAWLGGMFFERTGGYGPAFALGCAVLGAASIVSLLIDDRPHALSETAPAAGR
ncbi:MAG TPA: MFS transporter [Methylomirabilota bacterium]|nr:MFS transporter [Methylomirabilota bacterium]